MKKLSQKEYTLTHNESGYKKTSIVKQFRLPNGKIDTFFVDKGYDSVQIFPITKEGEVILVKQFRPGTEKEEIELPGGGLEEGEDPKLGAMRELMEETGFECKPENLIHIADLTYGPYSTGHRRSYMALECTKRQEGQELDDNEFLSVIRVPMKEFRELLRTGKIRGTDLCYLGLDKLQSTK